MDFGKMIFGLDKALTSIDMVFASRGYGMITLYYKVRYNFMLMGMNCIQ